MLRGSCLLLRCLLERSLLSKELFLLHLLLLLLLNIGTYTTVCDSCVVDRLLDTPTTCFGRHLVTSSSLCAMLSRDILGVNGNRYGINSESGRDGGGIPNIDTYTIL